jgi:hypothetical protein
MSEGRLQRFYAAALIALFAAVALARFDLFLEAFRATLQQLQRGGAVRWRILGEVVLFGGIILLTLRIIPARIHPRRDALIALLASAAGWLIEVWGTRAGLWSYYTRESPPLWIVPVWPLGALVVDRIAGAFEARFGPACDRRRRTALYRSYCILFAAIFAAFVFPAASTSLCAALLAAILAGLLLRPLPNDIWLIAAGLAYVFFADFWGTTNGCWAYYPRAAWAGNAFGILFGMFLDSAVVLLCLKTARWLLRAMQADAAGGAQAT